MSKEYIASVLKRLRLKSGLTADEVGEMVGKSGKTVNGWENARSQPDAEILLQLCDIYKVEDIMFEFRELKEVMNEKQITLTSHEKKVVTAYRNKPEMQPAVDKLLGITDEETIALLTVARSVDNRPVSVERISKEELERIRDAKSIEDEVDL